MQNTCLCTFSTLFERYKFKHFPFRLSSAPDVFQKVMTEIFESTEGVEIVVVWVETEKQHHARLIQVFEQEQACRLILNEESYHI